MRKIDKDLSVIPNSLYNIGIKEGKKTDRKRRILMSSTSRYKNAYDECYKWKDIQDILALIYRNKCVYCEEKITKVNAENLSGKEEISHTVEHYRPKSKYPWLAFSWDNLFWCCKKCTDIKDNNFEIINKPIIYSTGFKSRIHYCTKLYNRVEKPTMVHPELEDVMDKLVFDRNGNITSKDDRVKYTITTCGLDRNYLNGKRKKILDDFVNNIEDNYLIFEKQQDILIFIPTIQEFINNYNIENEFYTFKGYILSHLDKFFEDNILSIIEKIIQKKLMQKVK